MMVTIGMLEGKVDELVQKYQDLKSENERLKHVIAGQNTTIFELQKKITEQVVANRAIQEGSILASDADKNDMIKRLDEAIAEIDKLLITLND